MSAEYNRPLNDMKADALDRDPGLNAILLDMATKLGKVDEKVTHIMGRQAVIEQTLWVLEGDRLKAIGLRDGVARYAKLVKNIWLVAGAILAWIAAHFAGLLPR